MPWFEKWMNKSSTSEVSTNGTLTQWCVFIDDMMILILGRLWCGGLYWIQYNNITWNYTEQIMLILLVLFFKILSEKGIYVSIDQ